MDPTTQEKILGQCKKNVERGRAVATGIGLFALIYEQDTGAVLLVRRKESGSLISDRTDFAGKYELPGGGIDLEDIPKDLKDYTGVFFNTLAKEIREETGLTLSALPEDLFLIPAALGKLQDGIIDLAFVTVIELAYLEGTEEFEKMNSSGEIKFFPIDDFFSGETFPEMISLRMEFLLRSALKTL